MKFAVNTNCLVQSKCTVCSIDRKKAGPFPLCTGAWSPLKNTQMWFWRDRAGTEPADTLILSFAEPPLSDDLQPSSTVSSPTQPGPVLYMPSAAGDSVPVSPSSPHAPDLSAVRACPGSGWALCLARSQHLPLMPPLPHSLCLGRAPWYFASGQGVLLFLPQGFSVKIWWRVVYPEPVLVSLDRAGRRDTGLRSHSPHNSLMRFGGPLMVADAHWQMKTELSSLLKNLLLRRG